MTKQQMFEYINNNPSDYYMVTWNGHTEPLYFYPWNKHIYFESPIEVRRSPITDQELWDYVKETYIKVHWKEAYKNELKNLIDGYWYEIDCPQCQPFLPLFDIDNIYGISEQDLLKSYIIPNWEKE